MKKQELIDQLQGTTYNEFMFMPISKVIELVGQLEDSASVSLDENDIADIARSIAMDIDSSCLDLIRDYELSISCREVEIDSIDWNNSDIETIVTDTIVEHIRNKGK